MWERERCLVAITWDTTRNIFFFEAVNLPAQEIAAEGMRVALELRISFQTMFSLNASIGGEPAGFRPCINAESNGPHANDDRRSSHTRISVKELVQLLFGKNLTTGTDGYWPKRAALRENAHACCCLSSTSLTSPHLIHLTPHLPLARPPNSSFPSSSSLPPLLPHSLPPPVATAATLRHQGPLKSLRTRLSYWQHEFQAHLRPRSGHLLPRILPRR